MSSPATAQRPSTGNNIKPPDAAMLTWDETNISGSLNSVLTYAEDIANKAIAWYWQHKKWKAKLSRAIQLIAMASTALAGLVPVIAQLFPARLGPFFGANTGLWSSALVGLAAALIGIDKAFGFSSGWARYVLTATNIRKALEEFRVDWIILAANAGRPPSPADIRTLLARAREFCTVVEGLVLQETKDWVNEFQSNIAQLEKETKTQLDAMKLQLENAGAGHAIAQQPGCVELTVVNADITDDYMFRVLFEGAQGPIAEETVRNSKQWIRLLVPPGQYTATVNATAAGKPTSQKVIVIVKPDVPTTVDVTLP